jgi:BirA family biotin operon repressor/biotin-[acetyl-CoA-carboxylase] ligase
VNTGRIDIARLQRELATRRVGRRIEHFDELPSTNKHLLSQPHDADVDGCVVIAEFQSGGRGRHGSRWQCPRGAGILCTVGLHDDDRTVDAGLLALIVPIALCDGILAAAGVRCAIDWPNDIVADEGKLAGVLIEAHACGPTIRYAIGFGVNCLQHSGHFPVDIRSRATSLDLLTHTPVDRGSVLATILTALDNWLAMPGAWQPEAVRAAWRERALGLGRRVNVAHHGMRFTGHLVDIDPTAAIVVQLDEGGRRLFGATSTSIDWVR